MLKNAYFKLITVVLVALLATGCDTPSSHIQPPVAKVVAQGNKHYCVWERISSDFSFLTNHRNTRVNYFVKQYTGRHSHNLVKHSGQAAPYLYHVVDMLQERGMPVELALLPIVESEYRPQATSKRGAVGLWQLAATTGKMYGLKKDSWHDGRRDIEAATAAALDHLKYLNKKYDGDWLLTLAAYNAGAARIDQAIRNNKRAGKPTDYWSLILPKETMHYVPKFLALVYVVKHAKSLGIDLQHVPNQPYFTKVKLDKPIDLSQAAKLAQLDLKEIKKLNPALHQNKTHPSGPHAILLPVKNATIFKSNLVLQQKRVAQLKKS